MMKMHELIDKEDFIRDQYKKYAEKHFKIELCSLNFFLREPYVIDKDKITTINNLDCIRDEDYTEDYTKEFKDFVNELKSGEKLTGVFQDHLLNRDYFFKKDENGVLIDILLSFEFLMNIIVYYFEC